MSTLKVNSIIPVAGVGTDTTTLKNGGGIVQIKQTIKTNTFSTNSTSLTFSEVTGLSVTITPTSNTSKIFVFASVNLGTRGDSQAMLKLKRGSTDIYVGDGDGDRVRCAAEGHTGGTNHGIDNFSISFVDDPQTTSATTYGIFMRVTGNTHYVNRTNPDDNATYQSRVPSSITVMEVSA